jgi:hypothetical protein
MKGACFRLIRPASIVLYGKGGVCPSYPVVVSMEECVSYLAVVSTRTSLFSATCVYPILWRSWTALRLTYHLIFYILLPRCQNLLLFSAMLLCYAYAYAYAPLCISPPLSLISIPVLSGTSLQQDVCGRLILGYNRWYFYLVHPTPFCQCHSTFADECTVACDVFSFSGITRGLAKLFFRIRQGRRLYDRPGCGWQVARICIPHIRRSSFGQRCHGPGAFPGRQGRLCAVF